MIPHLFYFSPVAIVQGPIRFSSMRREKLVWIIPPSAAVRTSASFSNPLAAARRFFDYDGDGDLDLYVVDGSTYANYGAGPGNVLYRNDGGVFVAVVAGVEDRGWGMGVAVGDYDGDGQRDLYVTNYGANALYRNRGDGTFASVTVAG